MTKAININGENCDNWKKMLDEKFYSAAEDYDKELNK
jgi:hypothetical protein